MNGKTVKKRLMKSRTRVLWGQRAYLTVRLPATVASPRPPMVTFEGLRPGTFEGYWSNEETGESVHINQVSSGHNPLEDERSPSDPVYFLEDDDGSWTWWSGFRVLPDGTVEALPEALVGQYRAYRRWGEALHYYGQSPTLDSFLGVGPVAATHLQSDLAGKFVYVTYGVKWFRPDLKLRFCSALSRAVKKAKAAGVAVRVS